MKKTFGATTDTETVRLGHEALVRHAAYKRLRALRGGEPHARDVPRRRENRSEKGQGGLMILVDTSVWIRFLAIRTPYAVELDRLLSLDEVTGHELVYGELLTGESRRAPEAVGCLRRGNIRRKSSLTILASAIVGRLRLWTADACCAAVARELGVAYTTEARLT